MSKNSSKTAKNTEKWFSQNISGKTCSQAICVWATLIQVNQDNSASVWWTAHVQNRFVDENVLSENLTVEENRLWPKMANNLSFDW